jgi:hypothetical protein
MYYFINYGFVIVVEKIMSTLTSFKCFEMCFENILILKDNPIKEIQSLKKRNKSKIHQNKNNYLTQIDA